MNQKLKAKRLLYLASLILLTTPLVFCGGSMNERTVQYKNINDVPDAEWRKLSSRTFFFGHQSVGNNILAGMKDVISEKSVIKLDVLETKDKKDLEDGMLAHFRVGANLNPIGKIEDFAALMENGLGNKVDYAFVKLCYLDIDKKTQVEMVFEAYVKIMGELQAKFPETTFIHFTSPLTVSKISWKTKLKKSLGIGELWELNDNIKRNQFNTLLKNKYQNNQPVFDIATIEATLPDGKQYQFEMEGIQYQYLAPEYTSDGGHLNKYGQKIVAEQLLLMLLQLK